MLISAVSYAQAPQGDSSLPHEITVLNDEILSMLPEREERRFLAQNTRWVNEYERVCGRKVEPMRCRQHVSIRIAELKKLKLMWSTLHQSRESIEKIAPKIPVANRARLNLKQVEWEKRHRSICFRDSEGACRGSLESWNDDVNAALRDMRFAELSKEIKVVAGRRLDKIKTEYLYTLPRAERDPFIQENKTSKLQFEIGCASIKLDQGVNFLTGAPIGKSEQYICEARASDSRAIEFDEKLAVQNPSAVRVPTGCFEWSDGVSVMHETPDEPHPMGGGVSLVARTDGLNLYLNSTGINGHTCDFSIFAVRNGDSFKYNFRIPDRKESCELQVRFSPNFMLLDGIAPQGNCSAYLGCGFRAYLPDAIPLTEVKIGARCELPVNTEVGSGGK